MTPAGATPLGEGGEFDLIRLMQERWGPLAVGIGDDAAVLESPRGERLLVSTDAAVEGVHFVRGWITLEEIAYRAVTAALSDLAAMAAAPLGVLVSLELAAPDAAAALADGIADAVRQQGTVVRGGNVTAGQRLAITTTVLGCAHAPLARASARPGDALYVTGALGGPGAAVRAFRAGQAPPDAVRARFARPSARIREAQWLARRGAVAAIDISDGLGGDAMHLAAACGAAIELELDDVPLVPGAAPDDVLGGEEYELLVASRGALPADEFQRVHGVPLTRVGRVLDGAGGVRVLRGGRIVASPRGHDHFSR